MSDPTTLALQAWLDSHAAPTDHDRRVIDADLLPGGEPDHDPTGRRADEAAARAYWAMVEPESGRWAT